MPLKPNTETLALNLLMRMRREEAMDTLRAAINQEPTNDAWPRLLNLIENGMVAAAKQGLRQMIDARAFDELAARYSRPVLA